MSRWIGALLALAASSRAQAWGGRGHAAICETAVFLLEEPGLKAALRNKPQMMAHLCNLPDTYWRSLGPEINKLGNPTHFIDVEILGLEAARVPTDFKAIVDGYTGKPDRFAKRGVLVDVPGQLGSLWWRADQFYRRFLSFNRALQAAEAPRTPQEAADASSPYNQAAYEMIVSLGLMGHFVGDASQPLHSTADYDGAAAGHGGLHAYYEDEVVAQFDGDLHGRILGAARAMTKAPFLRQRTVIEKMRALSAASVDELGAIYELDPLAKAAGSKSEGGAQAKPGPRRESAALGYQRLRSLVVIELSRAALLLARLWDEAYVEAGRPKLASSKTYRYPLTVEFVPPDYLPSSTQARGGKE